MASWGDSTWDWNPYATPKRKKGKGKGKGKQSEKQSPKGPQYTGYDGKPVSLPAASTTPSTTATSSMDEVGQLKDMIRRLANGEQIPQEELKGLEASPREELTRQQREFNQKRKKMNREKGLEAKLQKNESNYDSWVEQQKTLMKTEKERYQEEQHRLLKDLETLRRPPMDMVSEEEEEMVQDQPTKSDRYMEHRVLQAERMATDTQQALIALQGQMQVLLSHLATQPAEPATYPAADHTGVPMPMERPPKHNRSPQMPRQVRKACEGRAEVAKTHPKPRTSEAPKDKPKETPKERVDTIEIEDDEPEKSDL